MKLAVDFYLRVFRLLLVAADHYKMRAVFSQLEGGLKADAGIRARNNTHAAVYLNICCMLFFYNYNLQFSAVIVNKLLASAQFIE